VKVTIDAGGRRVTLEADHGELATMVFLAKNMWIDTEPPAKPAEVEASPGPAQTIQTQTNNGSPRPLGHGRYGYGFKETNA
jgi:hypothetical protein